MKTHKRKLFVVLLAIFCLSLILLPACGKKKQPDDPTQTDDGKTDYGIDNVYYAKDDGKEYLFTITGDSFLLSGFNGEQTGKFVYADGELTLTFKEGDDTQASATLEDGVLKLTYNGGTYRLVLRTYYTVSFDVDGGSAVESQKVLNGDTAAKPADSSKDGYAFIGWYTDKEYKNAFAFDTTVISGDTTVYARFEEHAAGKPEYQVSFACDGAVYDPIRTVNGVAYRLPTPVKEGAEFAGWWVSDYQSGDKLTYQYTGQKLTEDTILFAVFKTSGVPNVSVDAEKISWNALGPTASYRVTVKMGDKVLEDKNVGANEFKFDFSNRAAGEYTVTVSCDGKSATAYYKNKALDRVSNFRVVSGSVLVFDPVANAQNYLITVRCANADHTHVAVNNGNSTNYVFANCDMPADGIVFVVMAKADGYMESVASYTYYLGLDAVTGVTVDNGNITWYPVENATAYYVEISKGGSILKNAYVTSGTSYSIADLDAGVLSVKVTPVSAGYYSAPAEAVGFTKTMLARPDGIAATGNVIRWNKVEGATGYKVSVNGTVYDVTDATFTITEEMMSAGTLVYSVSVQAVAADAANNSPYSETASVNYAGMGDVVYENGVLRWTPVITASRYSVKIGTKTYTVDGKNNTFKVTFLEAGTTDISVSFINENGDESARKTITVDVYGIEFDVRGGAAVKTVYVAFGDGISLPETSRDGYDFAGWFTSPAGLSGGKRYDNVRFEGNSDTVLYAGWSAKKYSVTLTPGEGGTVDSETASVTYGLYNKLPVAVNSDPTKLFIGWFSEPNGVGIRYTDENGDALIRWNLPSETTLYAYFAETLKFTSIDNGTAYAVSQGDYGIGSLTTITIPTSYKGLPVTTVEASAFVSCNTLREIRIPNTIKLIEIGSEGINGVGSAFQSCNNLRAITIYPVEGAKDIRYHSVDGVLYYDNEFTGMEIKAYPYAKTGALEIEEGATIIPTGAFKYAKFTEVLVPHTVTEIHANAFQSCSNLTKITFLVAPEDVAEVPLTVKDKAIYSCSKLESVTLPARLTSFGVNTIYSCSALSSIDIAGTGGNYTAKGEAGRKVLCNAAGDTIIFCPKGMSGEFTVPNGITTIAANAFQGCNKLSKVTIPGFVTEIQKEAFKSCSGLEEIDLTEEGYALTIRESAFYSCSGLTSVTLPKRLVKMEANAFGYTSKLTSVIVNSAGVAAGEDGKRTVDFATNAFGSIPASSTATTNFYVTYVELGADVPEFEITGVFGQKIESVKVDEKNQNYTAIDGVLFDKAVTKVVYYPTDRTGDYTLPETITEIGDRVFQGKTGLTGITIGKNVKSIGVGAFKSCSKLVYVRFADSTEKLTIADDAFNGCSVMEEIQLPARLTDIGTNAFASCRKLSSLTIPEGVTHIGSGAFATCSVLTEISLPKSLKTMDLNEKGEFSMFSACPKLEKITVASDSTNFAAIDNVLYQRTDKPVLDADGNKVLDAEGKETTENVISTLLFCPQRKAGSTTVTVPDSVTNVAANAFFYNQVVTEIRFGTLKKGDTLTVGNQAFGSCAVLAKIALPEGLDEIPDSMFFLCQTLEEIVIPSTVKSIGNQAFYGCSKLETLTFSATPEGQTPVELVILDAPSGSSNYTKSPFYGCTSLKHVVLPERLTVIGRFAFGGLVSGMYGETYVTTIESISLPSTLKEIHEYAFQNARNLKSVTFAPGTTFADACDGKTFSIGTMAFYYCTSLTSIVLPTSADPETTYSIGNNAFAWSGLTEIVIPKAVGMLGNNVFNRCTSLATVTFEAGANPECGTSLFSYTAISGVTLPEGLDTISNYMFQGCGNLTSVTIPTTVKTIGLSAFDSCKSLAKITFATYEKDGKYYSNVNSIGNNAFSKTAITSFTFPTLEGTNTLKIGDSIFSSCMKLQTVGLSKSVAEIGNAFANCYSISNFTVEDGNMNFSSRPGSPILYNLNGTAYKYICGQLPAGEYVIPEGVTSIGDNVFKGQLGITKIVIPRTMQTIGDNAFEGCVLLETVIFEHSTDRPSQLTQDDSYGTNLFKGCTALKYVTLPANITVIPNQMFYQCSSLETIVIPYGVTSIGQDAFGYTSLRSVSIPATVQTIGNYAFEARKDEGKLASVTFEKEADGSTALKTIGNVAFKYQCFPTIEIPKSVTSIGNNSFSYNPALVSFTFEAGTQIKSFGTSLIANCPLIETFTVPKSVTTLGNSDFENCTSLKSVIFEEGSALTSVGSSTFEASGIVSITFPEGVTTFTTVKSPKVTTSNTLFQDCVNLTSVTFGSKTTFLAKQMFKGCTALETINIPDTVNMIGAECFKGCTALKTVNFGENSQVTKIGESCFAESGLESIVLPASFTKFGYGSSYSTNVSSYGKQFLNCKSLKSVEFKGKLEVICGYVFQGCEALESIDIPASVTIIGNSSFLDCTALKTVTINSSGALVIGSDAFSNTAIASVTIPKGTTKIDSNAFKGCANLTTVDFAAGTATLALGTGVFESCTALTSIALPDRVKALPNYAFRYDSALENITFNKVTSIGNGAFSETKALKSVTLPATLTKIGSDAFLNAGLESITIPKATISIAENVFAGCGSLATFNVEAGNTKYGVNIGALVEISGGVSKIIALPCGLKGVLTVPEGTVLGGYALNGMSGITQVILPEGTTKIEANAFRFSKVTSVVIPSTVTEIGNYAFADSSVTSIVIPASVTTIGNYAFCDSENLASITFEEGSQLVELGTHVFEGTAIQSIELPAGIVRLGSTDYIASYTFKNCKQLSSVTFLGELVAINPNAFFGCEALKSFTIPETVTVLGSDAFEESGLETIEIPAGLKSLYVSSSTITGSGYTFRNCKSLKTVILHEGLECINSYAFFGCDALETIVIPSTVTEIGACAFQDCVNLKTVIFEGASQLVKIGNQAFKNTGLESVVMPDSVKTLGTEVFADCAQLKSVKLSESLAEIPSKTFINCVALEGIAFPASVTSLGASAFENSGIKSLTVTAKLVKFNSSPFKNCKRLETVVFEEGCETVTGSMFSGCENLKSVKLASTITTITSSAFANCTSLKEIIIPMAVSSVGMSTFDGWTADQTIKFMCSESDSTVFTSSWKNGCEATIVWDYTPSTEA